MVGDKPARTATTASGHPAPDILIVNLLNYVRRIEITKRDRRERDKTQAKKRQVFETVGS